MAEGSSGPGSEGIGLSAADITPVPQQDLKETKGGSFRGILNKLNPFKKPVSVVPTAVNSGEDILGKSDILPKPDPEALHSELRRPQSFTPDEAGMGKSLAHRPSRESLDHMKYLRSALPEVRKEIPEVRGLAFFGSRPRGQEKQDPNRQSDLDTVVFYDGSENSEQKDNSPQSDKKLQLQEKLKQTFGNLMQQRGLPVDILHGFNGTIWVVDISQAETDKALGDFKTYIDRHRDRFKDGSDWFRFILGEPAFPITSRFLLGTGDELYKNRGYILDRLDEMEKNDRTGKGYFRGLMGCLRDLRTDYQDHQQPKRFPSTIQEARSFFQTAA